jgi:hypothetical protein
MPANTRFVDLIFEHEEIVGDAGFGNYIDNVRLFWELPATNAGLTADVFQTSGVTEVGDGIPLRVSF